MRRSCELVARILQELMARVEPGVSTRDIDRYAQELIRKAGAQSAFLGYRGFPGHICISVNEEVVHGIGGDRKIQYGDLVKLDVGIVKDGWVGDTAATVVVGVSDAESLRLVEVTRGALSAGIEQAWPGKRVGDISHAIESYVCRHGFSVVREFVGHGVGRRLHEEPQVPNFGRPGTGPKLRSGMTLAIEPMVNAGLPGVEVLGDGWTVVTVDRKRSAHFEHTVLVTEEGPQILTLADPRVLALGQKLRYGS
jgi:methionyl aminopeptidase